MNDPITTLVVVAEADHVRLERIRSVVESDPALTVVATARNREDAAQLLRRMEPDAAVVDVGLLSFCEHPLHGWGPVDRRIRLIAVGYEHDPWVASHVHAAGFVAYVPADRLDEELCPALRGAPSAGAQGAREASWQPT